MEQGGKNPLLRQQVAQQPVRSSRNISNIRENKLPRQKVEERVEPAPQSPPQARLGLSNLLGGWWSKSKTL